MAFAIFFGAGVAISVVVFLEPIGNLIKATRWEPVRCSIVTSRVEEVPEKKGFVADVKYAYRFAGAQFHSNRVWFIRPTWNTLGDAQKVARKYPKGLETHCYVNPDNPAYAVLERGAKPELLIALAPVVLMVIGLAGFFSSVGPLVFPASRRRWWVLVRREGFGRPSKKRRVLAPGGPYTFRPRHRNKATRFFVAFALLWNGVMVFLVREVIDNWRDGIPGFYGWSLTLFAVPMVLIGMGAIIPPMWALMRWLNPRPILTLSSTTVAPGGEISIRWRFWGSTRRVRRLRLFVEGREEATYTRGTETYTDYDVFSVTRLIDASEPARVRSGQLKLAIAPGAVPSFRSEHNAIVWSLRIHADCGRWPDIDEEFAIAVLPQPESIANS